MVPEKVNTVVNWPAPMDRKQLQHFRGFANFYCRFIWNYSQVAAPLHALISANNKFSQYPEADAAFQSLLMQFSSTPILCMPDPNLQFTVALWVP